MEIIMHEEKYFEEVYNVVHDTIEKIYPKYYPRKAVIFSINIILKKICWKIYPMNIQE
jgi:hypothetical protein